MFETRPPSKVPGDRIIAYVLPKVLCRNVIVNYWKYVLLDVSNIAAAYDTVVLNIPVHFSTGLP